MFHLTIKNKTRQMINKHKDIRVDINHQFVLQKTYNIIASVIIIIKK